MVSVRLKELRMNQGLTQKELAQKLKIAPSTIAMIESGKREGNSETLDKIADFFNVSLDYLYGKDKNTINISEPKESLIDKFLNDLIDEGIIEDSNDIDDEVAELIINTVKTQVAIKLKKRKNL